jgi:hypothetical protein
VRANHSVRTHWDKKKRKMLILALLSSANSSHRKGDTNVLVSTRVVNTLVEEVIDADHTNSD